MNNIIRDHDGDYSQNFQVLRPLIVNKHGLRYVDFIKTLRPNYSRLFVDIGLGYAALMMTGALVALAPSAIGWAAAMAGALSFGFWIAYLQLFIHEGAHFNFAADKARSDLLCNVLVAWLLVTSVQQYRIVHFQHHRALGQTDDSEISYFFPLNILFIIKGLFGFRLLEVVGARHSFTRGQRPTKDGRYVGPIGLFIHLSIVMAAFMSGAAWLSVAWIVGALMVFPLLAALRQLLEHRDPKAHAATCHYRHAHGAYTRIFGADLFSSLFGGAGFNRHLLHHWEPQVSYTNLSE